MRAFAMMLFVCLIGLNLQAQKEETLFNQTNLRLSGAWGTATYNFSAFNGDEWTLIRGGYGGVEFGRTLFVGWGRYETRDPINFNDGIAGLQFRYGEPVVSISPQSTKLIHPRITFLTGSGKASLTEGDGSDRVFVFQPSAGIELNVFQWFRLGFEGGYRFVGESTPLGLDSGDMSAPFAQVEMRFGLSWGINNNTTINTD
ncbi:MAG: hypothetical protein R2795_09925 [Saprospiraceae bacterium]